MICCVCGGGGGGGVGLAHTLLNYSNCFIQCKFILFVCKKLTSNLDSLILDG